MAFITSTNDVGEVEVIPS